MIPGGPVRGACDAQDRLIEADGALAGLQLRSGGDLPGQLAVPALLALVRSSRVAGVAQRRRIAALDEGRRLEFFAVVEPAGEGTTIALSHWRVAGDRPADPVPDHALLHQLAAAHAVIDADQQVMAVDIRCTGADRAAIEALALVWRARDRAWSEALEWIGLAHHQPLHWRLLDDAAFRLPGSARVWRARLLPQSEGALDLLILPETLDALPGEAVPAPVVVLPPSRVIGRDLAPALRQPITRIIANAETIRTRLAGPLADAYATYAADIAEAGRHLLALVEDLADLDAVEAPDFAPAPDRIDLADCARRAAGILAMRAQERALTLVAPDAGVQVPATGEFRRVLQVLLNLLTNAIRYSPQGTTVTIATGGDATRAWIAVSDQGEGLSEDEAARVFDKFERLGRSGDGGSGLGLYISRRLARAMGGDLTVNAGPGARFELSLPGRAPD